MMGLPWRLSGRCMGEEIAGDSHEDVARLWKLYLDQEVSHVFRWM